MTVESASDRATFLADFGVDVIFSPGDTYPNRNNQTAWIKGIFDNEYYRVEGENSVFSASQPRLHVRSADIDSAERNSMAEIGSDKYKVTAVEPDGTGFSVLLLEGPRQP